MRHKLIAIIKGKKYDTETALLIASNEYWDGSNFERGGTNTHLYRTKKGAYFTGYSTCWQGSRSFIEVVSKDQAKTLYEQMPEHPVDYAIAFPGEPLEDA